MSTRAQCSVWVPPSKEPSSPKTFVPKGSQLTLKIYETKPAKSFRRPGSASIVYAIIASPSMTPEERSRTTRQLKLKMMLNDERDPSDYQNLVPHRSCSRSLVMLKQAGLPRGSQPPAPTFVMSGELISIPPQLQERRSKNIKACVHPIALIVCARASLGLVCSEPLGHISVIDIQIPPDPRFSRGRVPRLSHRNSISCSVCTGPLM
ncbi:hypothetical protein Hypma_006195 [Hypsizygus marmoreus]|uniref:Uncharacterized protein n=1 Tax=Hypsizygus marmoreus TaxID=39966 RepID=A0A369K2Q4_HYPMA|nr:hypothetical protein Hypma_006195 [Hypsizygus marmoreus]